MLQKPLARRVATAGRRFHDRALWNDFNDQFLFAIELPGEPLPIYAIVLGAAGRQFGLSMYLGERALEQVHYVTTSPRPPFVAPMLLLSFDPVGSVAPEYRELSRLAGIDDRVLPVVQTVPAGGKVRPASTQELRLVAQVVEALLQADDNDVLRPQRISLERGGKVLTLTVAGEAGKVQGVSARFVQQAPLHRPDGATPPLPWPLPELPLVGGHWVVGFEPSPIGVANEPIRPWLLFVVDTADERLLGMRLVTLAEPDDLEEALHEFAQILADPRDGEPGLPRHLTVTHDRLARALADLDEHGVEVDCQASHPSADKVVRHLREHLGRERDGASELPRSSDPQHWLPHHRLLEARIAAALDRVDVHSRKARTTFFGADSVCDELDEEGSSLHHVSLRDWYVTSFRSKSRSRTIAEQLLAGTLPAAERCLLEARVAARTGLWVVARRQPPIVVLRDVFTDREVEIHDGNLAASTTEGCGLPARIADANGHRFVVPLGPMIPPLRLDAALQDLQESFGTFTSEDLQRRPEMLATLWEWALDEAAIAPLRSLTNTDGDELELLVATFRVADWPRFTAELRKRSDVDCDDDDESDGRWTWYRAGEDRTLLASMERVVDELLVEVNSQPRLNAVRAWLLAIPGVAFVDAREQADEGATRSKQRSIDPMDLSPEVLAQIQAQLDARTMRWLDERVPALGNKTPREAVRTSDGRETVLRLIRSWPDPVGIPGLRTPRERLRRELGLPGPDQG
jgi:hypothetical protein